MEKKKDSKINYLFNNSVLIFFAIIIILNITGFVGTLTGSKNLDINDQDKIAMLFAAPFYLLSMGAYLTDVSKRKIKTINPVLFFVYKLSI